MTLDQLHAAIRAVVRTGIYLGIDIGTSGTPDNDVDDDDNGVTAVFLRDRAAAVAASSLAAGVTAGQAAS